MIVMDQKRVVDRAKLSVFGARRVSRMYTLGSAGDQVERK